MRRGAAVAATIILAAAFAHGCAKNAPRDSQAPEATGAPAGGEEAAAAEPESAAKRLGFTDDLEDDIAKIEDRLASVDDELEGAGVSDEEAFRADAGSDKCQRVCDLAEAICDLEGKICDLAEKHEGEERYAAACTRADEQCEKATTACTACAG